MLKNYNYRKNCTMDNFNLKPKCWIICVLVILGVPSAMNSSEGSKGEWKIYNFVIQYCLWLSTKGMWNGNILLWHQKYTCHMIIISFTGILQFVITLLMIYFHEFCLGVLYTYDAIAVAIFFFIIHLFNT